MDVSVYLKIGKEINEQTKTIITKIFESKNLRIETEKINDKNAVGFIIRNKVPDVDAFVESIYRTLQQVPNLYLVAPKNCFERIKHHPRVHCFDSKILEDPETGVLEVINFAYHGRPL